MREKTYFPSVLVLAGALIISAAPVSAQSTDEEKKDRDKGQVESSGQTEKKSEERTQVEGPAGNQVQSTEKSVTRETRQTQVESRATAPAGASGASASVSTEEIKQIQLRLKEQGYDPGPADGIMGSRTQHALKSFQQSKGLQATGRLDEQTKMQLGLQKNKAGMGKGKAAAREGNGSEVQSKKNENQGQSQKGAGKEMEKGTQ